jgi:predicted nucleic acid-binding Zn ribbon protein
MICLECNGNGFIKIPKTPEDWEAGLNLFAHESEMNCPTCEGDGELPDIPRSKHCPTCGESIDEGKDWCDEHKGADSMSETSTNKGNTKMGIHKHLATAEEIAKSARNELDFLVLRIEPQPEFDEQDHCYYWHPPTSELNRRLSAEDFWPYHIGDRLYLAQEWCEYNNELLIRQDPNFGGIQDSSLSLEWQPASSMGAEKSRYFYEINRVMPAKGYQESADLYWFLSVSRISRLVALLETKPASIKN